MLKMSFYNGTLDRVKAKETIDVTKKGFVYTIGLSYRNPTTHRKPITREKALELIETESMLNITEEENVFHLNSYSSNDMW